MVLDLRNLPFLEWPDDGPFTDDMVRHYVKTLQTQHGIIKYAEAMAKFLAEAGRASEQAVGDSPAIAVSRWCDVIKQRALELLRESPKNRLEAPTINQEKDNG